MDSSRLETKRRDPICTEDFSVKMKAIIEAIVGTNNQRSVKRAIIESTVSLNTRCPVGLCRCNLMQPYA